MPSLKLSARMPKVNNKLEFRNIVIIGGSGGIGEAFIKHLLTDANTQSIHATYNKHPPSVINPRCQWYSLDITDEAAIETFCSKLGDIDLLINTAGILHNETHQPEKSTRQINAEYFLNSMRINALPTLLIAKYMATHFTHKRPSVFATISARVGSIEENYLGGWYSYRASKSALNMILKTLSIEWKRSLPNVAIAALHPGTTNTQLSRPFQKNVPAGQLFSPEQSVTYMMQVIGQLTPLESGRFWSFDGEQLPW